MLPAEYKNAEGNFVATDEMRNNFDEFGFIMIRGLFDKEEMKILKTVLETNDGITGHAVVVSDGLGKKSMLSLWNQPGNDVTGMFARCNKVVDTAEKLLSGEVYHYHTKLMMKEPFTGGQFVWHQDYGYWYNNGCLFPDMLTVFIPVDKCTQENGCLQVIPGSQKAGRIEHGLVGGQTGADIERVNDLLQGGNLEAVPVEMNPGDALFFHCNLLHKSAQNLGEFRRWAFLTAYNSAKNNPVRKHHHPQYIPLQKVPNSAIKECTNYTDFTGKDFLEAHEDKTVKAEPVKNMAK